MKMNVSEKKMRHLGRRLLNYTGDGEYHDEMEEQHRYIVSQCYNTERRYTSKHFVFAGILASAATALLVLLLMNGFQSEKFPFWIGPQQVAGVEGSWVAASTTQQTFI